MGGNRVLITSHRVVAVGLVAIWEIRTGVIGDGGEH